MLYAFRLYACVYATEFIAFISLKANKTHKQPLIPDMRNPWYYVVDELLYIIKCRIGPRDIKIRMNY